MERLLGLLRGPASLSSASAIGTQQKDVTRNIWKALDELSQDPQAYKDMMEELAAEQGVRLPDGLVERATGKLGMELLGGRAADWYEVIM